MVHEVETQWMGKMQFNAAVNGHTIIMDTSERLGGEDNGPIPKPLVLTALSGCTGMDVISLLRKEGKEVSSFDVKVTGELSKDAPSRYVYIHLVYNFNGDESAKEAALKAVTASQERLCGVSNMLKQIMQVTWEVVYNSNLIFTNKTAIAA